MSIHDIAIYLGVSAYLGVSGALFTVVFVKLWRLSRSVDETNGLYRVMLDYVQAQMGEPHGDDAGGKLAPWT